MHVVKFLFLSLCLSLIACSNDDDSTKSSDYDIPCSNELINFNKVYLSQESVEFIPYSGEEILYFKNEAGEEVKFESLNPTINHRFYQTNFKLECTNGDTNKYEFLREQYSVGHKCMELNLQFYLNLYVSNSMQYPEFVDIFSLVFHEPTTDNILDTAISLRLITSFKNEADLLSEEFKNYNRYELLNEVKLIDKTYNSVYKVLQEQRKLLTELYFTKEEGMVGFKDLNLTLWELDRIE